MLKKVASILLAGLMFFVMFVPFAHASDSTRDQVVSIAKQYLGVPYQWSGSSPSGFDCSGFTSYVFGKVGIDLPAGSYNQYDEGTYVSRSELKPGDLVFFSGTYKSGISHVGIYIGGGDMISATYSRGIDIDSVFSGYWSDYYTGAKRVIEDNGLYTDLSEDYWAYGEIEYLSKKGIIDGNPNGTFSPEDEVTRAEVAKMLSESMNLNPSGNNTFSDVSSSHWAYEFINAAAEKGYIEGYEDGTFRPDEAITRAEIAALFTRAFDLSGMNTAANFEDVSSSHWAYDEVYTLSANDITSGYKDDTFRPGKETTRAEFSVFLYRALHQ
ncbi:C40 family peptidase [Thalassobacillus pellis]|uniref:C40 family peptidase n=1 Tax=Thalassobacillus pellis TaxID=748008 RepID=UPI001EF86C7A|nr:C40 family peptidase [Thalassobacillus pellis]MBM7551685.1 hypothetical protein [Thalassobacillus pellis]